MVLVSVGLFDGIVGRNFDVNSHQIRRICNSSQTGVVKKKERIEIKYAYFDECFQFFQFT